jgi:hypothetical protein
MHLSKLNASFSRVIRAPLTIRNAWQVSLASSLRQGREESNVPGVSSLEERINKRFREA